jgi:hypothetical protein
MTTMKWFRHAYDASTEGMVERMYALYGNEGLGVYWLLVEKMHTAGGKINEEIIPHLARKFGCEQAILEGILNDFDLFTKKEKEYSAAWIAKGVRELDHVSKVRKSAIEQRWKRANKADTKPIQNEYKGDTIVDTNQIQTGYKPDTDKELDKDNITTTSVVVISATANAVATPSLPAELEFERVWQAYERKGSKKKSAARWKALPLKNKRLAAAYIPAYVAATPEKRYRKNFVVFINDEAWNDELPIYQPVKNQNNGKLDDFAERAARVAATATALLAGSAV